MISLVLIKEPAAFAAFARQLSISYATTINTLSWSTLQFYAITNINSIARFSNTQDYMQAFQWSAASMQGHIEGPNPTGIQREHSLSQLGDHIGTEGNLTQLPKQSNGSGSCNAFSKNALSMISSI
jgi:hypothetical protein